MDYFRAPFRIELPHGTTVRGAAFSQPFRTLALLLVAVPAAWGYRLWADGRLGHELTSSGLWLLAAMALMLITVFHVFRSQTSLSESHLRQSWIWDKEMLVAELTYVKLIRWRGFEWLIAPRLYARSHSGRFASFYCADPKLLAHFERLGQQLPLHDD